ncbi:hypothetical protein Lfu02_45430 [Longispora fulva]|uniref:Uncharacterized protein n=2 Tax=Longispora fulva TaxID=619741 RepID=A0A8J7GJU3_9ACTN|nr:hypothetical protein [Longispora fulva]MBG6137918.1 hypothetical protein [Longispora fulva]GIG60171.1 hypothetical protein Lfu02_45430 [Longispora fulva]
MMSSEVDERYEHLRALLTGDERATGLRYRHETRFPRLLSYWAYEGRGSNVSWWCVWWVLPRPGLLLRRAALVGWTTSDLGVDEASGRHRVVYDDCDDWLYTGPAARRIYKHALGGAQLLYVDTWPKPLWPDVDGNVS